MIPIHDDNPTRHPPVVTVVFIAINVLVFLWQISAPSFQRRLFQFAAVPYNVISAEGDREVVYIETRTEAGFAYADEVVGQVPDRAVTVQAIPAWLTLLTCMFMHGGWMHLIGNMVYLWIFGNNIEDALGVVRFIVFYLVTGLAASFAHIATDPGSAIPTVGASGAISGVLGGYLILYPKARILTLVPLGFILRTFYLPAMVFLPIWFLIQVFSASGGGGVAWWAHIGGFVAGLALVKLLETSEHRTRPPEDSFPPPVSRRYVERRPW